MDFEKATIMAEWDTLKIPCHNAYYEVYSVITSSFPYQC